MESLHDLVDRLPPDLQREVEDFAKFLLEKQTKPRQRRLRLSWAGGLKEYRDQFTSIELQKKVLDWWEDPLSSL